MCLTGAVVACWPLTQEVAGCAKFESFYCNDIFLLLNSLNSVKKHLGKTQLLPHLSRSEKISMVARSQW